MNSYRDWIKSYTEQHERHWNIQTMQYQDFEYQQYFRDKLLHLNEETSLQQPNSVAEYYSVLDRSFQL